jgi:hypothetical protein
MSKAYVSILKLIGRKTIVVWDFWRPLLFINLALIYEN